jgi:hypothetical protein
MNVSVDYIRPRMADDPGDADYMMGLSQVSGIRWEVPLTEDELKNIQPWLPKGLRKMEKEEIGGKR